MPNGELSSKTDYRPLVGPKQGTPEWYLARRRSIGASDCAAVCGVSEYRQPFQVYREKRGEDDEFDGNEFTARGLALQPFMAGEYTRQKGVELLTDLPQLIHPDFPYITASLDACWDCKSPYDKPRVVEFKATNWRRASKLGDDIETALEEFPDWNLQLQHQMLVAGIDKADLFVMVDVHTYRTFTVERDDDLCQMILQRLHHFWKLVQAGTPPDIIVNHPTTEKLLKRLYGVESGKTIDLPDDAIEAWEAYHGFKEDIAELQEHADQAKNQVLMAMGDAAIGRMRGSDREVTRIMVKASTYEVNRKAHVRLGERKARE